MKRRKVRIEGRPIAVLATMQNKTAAKTRVLTAVGNLLPVVDEFRNFLTSEEAEILAN
jgi:hypothetical protein